MYQADGDGDIDEQNIAAIVMETKHKRWLKQNDVAQVIVYYSRSAASSTRSSKALLLNGYSNKISFQVVLFPFYEERET